MCRARWIPALAVLVALCAAPAAHAAHVTRLQPWAATNTYLVETNLDGRARPELEPRAKVDWLKAGQWVAIQCQVSGQAAYGSTIWDKVGGYYVPDTYIKTYTSGFLSGAPRCSVPPPAPVPCSASGGGHYTCQWWRAGDGISAGAPVRNGADQRVGFLHQGANWIVCQKKGRQATSGAYYNDTWAWTLADDGKWGWVNAVWATGGDNDGAFGGGVPGCGTAHGDPPSGASAPPPPTGTTTQPAGTPPPKPAPGGDPTNTTPAPTPAPSSGCAGTTVRLGPVTATASCFRRDGRAYVATGQVRIAGVDVSTSGANAQVRIEPAALEVRTTGSTQVAVGNLVLYRRAIDWHLGGTFTFSVERDVKLRGLPVTGSATLTADARSRSVLIGLNVQLPGVLGGVTGATTIRASSGGVAVNDVQVTAGSARLGRFELRDLSLSYTSGPGAPHFEGQGTLVLPSPMSPTVTARLGFGMGDGYFHAGGDVANINRPLAYGIFLQRIRFDITVNPVKLSGGIGVSAGPRILGTEAVSIDGDFTFENSNPDRYTISGNAKVVDIPLASGSVTYQTDGRFDMSAQAKFEKFDVGFEGSLQGWVDGGSAFNVQGDGKVKAGFFSDGGDAVVSSDGVAACRHGWGPDVGFGYGWGSAVPHIFASSCNIGDWVVARSSRAAGPPTFGSFGIAGHQPVAVFSVVGSQAPPRATLTGPDGATVADTPTDPNGGIDDGRVLLFQNHDDKTTYIAVKNPAGGLYRLALQAGSSAATQFRSAQSLAAPHVRARVAGHGRHRVLRWSFIHVRGRSVVFYEQGRDTRRRLATSVHPRGRVGFTVPDGRPGRREIVAVVRQDGLTQSAGTVAHYAAPGPRRPRRPRFVHVVARHGRLVIRWGGAARAASYEVRVVLSDGRRLLFLPKRTTRRLTVAHVAGGTRASVTVRGVSATGHRGLRAHARVRARR